MQIKKVVPIILRQHDLGLQFLVFQHPLAGIQIVKGTVELNESLEEAALRELFEETGIQSTHIQSFLGIHCPKEKGPDWYVFVCETQENLLDQWVHYCHDDGGLEFKFFGIFYIQNLRVTGIHYFRTYWYLFKIIMNQNINDYHVFVRLS